MSVSFFYSQQLAVNNFNVHCTQYSLLTIHTTLKIQNAVVVCYMSTPHSDNVHCYDFFLRPCVVDVLSVRIHEVKLNIKIEDVFTMVEPTNSSSNSKTQWHERVN